ncbi:MAG: helix-turn-helix transcriptional regulator [Gammaproteobacteria bacterium]|nr:helix-turn-helix transcriptional regulator [Gammaproteobacteria bacterium]
MPNTAELKRWDEAVAGIIAANDFSARADALINAIGTAVRHEGTCLIAFHGDASPDVLHHTIEPAGAKHYLERYLAGPYLLDPLYQLAIAERKPSLCRFRDAQPDRFRSSEYYRKYCERTHLLDEMDFIARVSESTTAVLVVARRDSLFSKREINRLHLIEATVLATVRAIWEEWAAGTEGADDGMHARLTQSFERFGEGVLTDRERQISQLLLRGHSSKSIARELDIAPGTVMVHKRNLFAKLGISSQYGLFSLLLDSLEAPFSP